MGDWHASSNPDEPAQHTTTHNNHKPYISRTSPQIYPHAAVATSQPLASSIGLHILRSGGNATDASIAIVAALAVTEPCSTGLGGDFFALHYHNKTRNVTCVNGSGRSPADIKAVKEIQQLSEEEWMFSPHSVTVPGAARGWEDMLARHGSGMFTLSQLVEPAALLAEEGFPVSPVTARNWNLGLKGQIQPYHPHGSALSSNHDAERGPAAGEVFRNPDLARVLRKLGSLGASDGFYTGDVASAMVEAAQCRGGRLSLDDLKAHSSSSFPDPISVEYRGKRLWQVPPNGQGVAGLIALVGLDVLEEEGLVDTATCPEEQRFHAMMEMMRLGFEDARNHVTDPDYETNATTQQQSIDWLLDRDRIRIRAKQLYHPTKSNVSTQDAHPDPTPGTVSFQVVDNDGNATSVVNSNYMGFGTGIVPSGCGFTLQNRGYGFSREEGHANEYQPRKRPYHTIIPGLLTNVNGGGLYATLSNMGGFMQPQGHLQLTVAMLSQNLDPQAAIDAPRFCIADGTRDGKLLLEDGVDSKVEEALKSMGHHLQTGVSGWGRGAFGRAQIIQRNEDTGMLWTGSDKRADGCAMGY